MIHLQPTRRGLAATKILVVIAILFLLPLIIVELMAVIGEQRTENLRREIIRAGGKAITERHVPAWLQTLRGKDGHSFLDRTVIVEVLLNDPKIGDAEFRRWQGLTEVRVLAMGESSVTNAGLQHLQGMDHLESLDLNHAGVTDLAALTSLPKLQRLRLDFSQVPEKHLDVLAQLPELRKLSLAGMKVTRTGTELLAQCEKLDGLNLNGADLTDQGLAPLRALTNLQTLSLKYAKVDPEDLKAFQQAVPACNVIQ